VTEQLDIILTKLQINMIECNGEMVKLQLSSDLCVENRMQPSMCHWHMTLLCLTMSILVHKCLNFWQSHQIMIQERLWLTFGKSEMEIMLH